MLSLVSKSHVNKKKKDYLTGWRLLIAGSALALNGVLKAIWLDSAQSRLRTFARFPGIKIRSTRGRQKAKTKQLKS